MPERRWSDPAHKTHALMVAGMPHQLSKPTSRPAPREASGPSWEAVEAEPCVPTALTSEPLLNCPGSCRSAPAAVGDTVHIEGLHRVSAHSLTAVCADLDRPTGSSRLVRHWPCMRQGLGQCCSSQSAGPCLPGRKIYRAAAAQDGTIPKQQQRRSNPVARAKLCRHRWPHATWTGSSKVGQAGPGSSVLQPSCPGMGGTCGMQTDAAHLQP